MFECIFFQRELFCVTAGVCVIVGDVEYYKSRGWNISETQQQQQQQQVGPCRPGLRFPACDGDLCPHSTRSTVTPKVYK